jgi:hypothetical protein
MEIVEISETVPIQEAFTRRRQPEAKFTLSSKHCERQKKSLALKYITQDMIRYFSKSTVDRNGK